MWGAKTKRRLIILLIITLSNNYLVFSRTETSSEDLEDLQITSMMNDILLKLHVCNSPVIKSWELHFFMNGELHICSLWYILLAYSLLFNSQIVCWRFHTRTLQKSIQKDQLVKSNKGHHFDTQSHSSFFSNVEINENRVEMKVRSISRDKSYEIELSNLFLKFWLLKIKLADIFADTLLISN